METDTTIGISLGSRSLGIAVMRNGALIDWHIKSFYDAMTQQKLHMIAGSIMRLVQQYCVSAVVLKLPLAFEMHCNLVAVKKHLLKTFASKSIPVQCYTLPEIKAKLQGSICNKQQLATCMATLYPQLRFVYIKEQQLQNKYYLKLFEAVAALHVHYSGPQHQQA